MARTAAAAAAALRPRTITLTRETGAERDTVATRAGESFAALWILSRAGFGRAATAGDVAARSPTSKSPTTLCRIMIPTSSMAAWACYALGAAAAPPLSGGLRTATTSASLRRTRPSAWQVPAARRLETSAGDKPSRLGVFSLGTPTGSDSSRRPMLTAVQEKGRKLRGLPNGTIWGCARASELRAWSHGASSRRLTTTSRRSARSTARSAPKREFERD